ncbi:MAG: 6,7-dimethyl-8-ribityllumazine synthase [Demequinaceae bacterium]|nr:6,7-dimethyl-8-ribityllumazine synthase [Demequinaceae bacterium]
MSGRGAPDLRVDGTGLTVEIVASSWHDEVMDGLIAGAIEACEEAGADHRLIRVPGCFELPIVAEALARGGASAIVALGVVIRGGTPHFEYVSGAVTRGLGDVARSHAVAVGFGVLTCDTEEQARDRAGLPGSSESKGREAAEAAIDVATTLSTLG